MANTKRLTREELRKHLETLFAGKTLVSRYDPDLNTIVAAGTLANADSEGKGISARILIGNKTFYEKSATLDWIVDRAKE